MKDYVVCVAAAVEYSTRRVRDPMTGRKRRQRYRMSRFYESAYTWEKDTGPTADAAAEALPSDT